MIASPVNGTNEPFVAKLHLIVRQVKAYRSCKSPLRESARGRHYQTQPGRICMNAQAQTIETPVVRNGVDVTALFETIDTLKKDASLAQFRFRARNRWLGGDANRTTCDGFFGAGREQAHRQPFAMDCGEPAALLGEDRGANPVEHVLNALAGCLTTTMVYHAAARGITIGAVESELEGDIDLRGLLGISSDVRKGYRQVRVRMRVESDAAPATLSELARFSPVYDIVSNSLPVEVVVETYQVPPRP
jgi:uncharacterized OsmC-like protein